MEGLQIGDKVRFYGYAGLTGRGTIAGFTGYGLFAYVETAWAVSGDAFTARVAVMNITKENEEVEK